MNATAANLLLSLGSLIFLVMSGCFAVLVRSVQHQTRTDDKVTELAGDVKDLIEQKDKMHAVMMEQIRADREAADRRLRFMEEYFMRNSMGRGEAER